MAYQALQVLLLLLPCWLGPAVWQVMVVSISLVLVPTVLLLLVAVEGGVVAVAWLPRLRLQMPAPLTPACRHRDIHKHMYT